MALLNPNPGNKITCDDLQASASLKSVVFQNYSMSVVQGSKTLFDLLLKNLFLPLSSYQYSEFTLNASSSMMLDPGNVSNANSEVTGIFILVEYPATDDADVSLTESDKYINYTYPTGGDLHTIGKIMMLTGTADSGWNLVGSPGGMLLSNPHTNFDVTVKVLLIS